MSVDVRGRWARWVALTSEREPAAALAVFRVAIAGVVLYTVGTVVAAGLVPTLWMDFADGGYRDNDGAGSWLISALGGPSPTVVWGVVGAALFGGACLAVGLGTRAAAGVCLVSMLALADVNPHVHAGYDGLLTNALWLLVLADAGATLSVDAWRATGSWAPPRTTLKVSRWLVVGQLVLMYTSSAVHKVSVHWVPGGELDALYYVILQPDWARFADTTAVARVYPLTQAATAAVWWFELLAPALFWFMAWRRRGSVAGRRLVGAWATFGITMHLSIWALMEVGPFSWVSIAHYVALFGGAARAGQDAATRGAGRLRWGETPGVGRDEVTPGSCRAG